MGFQKRNRVSCSYDPPLTGERSAPPRLGVLYNRIRLEYFSFGCILREAVVRLVTAVGRSAAGWFGDALLVALLGSIESEVGPTLTLTGSMRGHLFTSNLIPLLQS